MVRAFPKTVLQRILEYFMSSEFTLSVVVPVLNEEKILFKNLSLFAAQCDLVAGRGNWKYIIVDNGSTDRTLHAIEELRAHWPNLVTVLEPTPNYGNALRAGIAAADTPWVKLIDVEQWDVPFFAWAWENRESHDVFIGAKRADPTINRQYGYRLFLSWGLNALLQLFFLYPGSETHGPKLMRMDAMRPIINRCCLGRGQFDTEILLRAARAGRRLVEAPVAYEEQRAPRSLMLMKIWWNVVEFNKLRKILHDVPYEGYVRLHRVDREDVLAAKLNRDITVVSPPKRDGG